MRGELDSKINDLRIIPGCQEFFKISKKRKNPGLFALSLFPHATDPSCYPRQALNLRFKGILLKCLSFVITLPSEPRKWE